MAEQSEFRGVFVDLDAGQLEVVAIAALSPENAEELVEEADVVYRHGEFDVAAVARAAVQCVETACCASAKSVRSYLMQLLAVV